MEGLQTSKEPVQGQPMPAFCSSSFIHSNAADHCLGIGIVAGMMHGNCKGWCALSLHTIHHIRNSKATRFCGIAPGVSSTSHHAALLDCDVARGKTCGVDRTSPIVCGRVAACHDADSSQCELTKLQIMLIALILKWHSELTCTKP